MVLPSEGTTLPANHTTIGIQGCLEGSSIMLSVERDGLSRPLDFEEETARGQWTFMDEPVTVSLHWTMLHIRAPLTAGDTLVLRYATDYDETEGRELADAGLREVEVRWPVVEEQELPSTLGALEVRKGHGVITVSADASCSRNMDSASRRAHGSACCASVCA
jgi:hypothetical protein